MTRLEREHWIEGRRREIGKTKLWRLSSIGRKRFEINKPPLAFGAAKVEHVLKIGDAFQTLLGSGRLAYFKYEPKDEFYAGRKMFYAPDFFFILKNPYASYLAEVQRTPISSERWAAKWAIANEYFSSEHYKTASWQVMKGKILKPKIIVLTEQQRETVQASSLLSLLIEKSIGNILQ